MVDTVAEGDRLRKIAEDVIKCPMCGERSMEIKIFIYDAPYFGKVVLESGKCSKCGFRWSDVGLLEVTKPKRIIVKIRKTEDLNALVIKAAPAVIKIPELGVEIFPGPAAPGYITTVEGILQRIIDHAPSECLDESNPCHEKIESIRRAMRGDIAFTLIIEDPSGRSAVKGGGTEVLEEDLKTEQKVSVTQLEYLSPPHRFPSLVSLPQARRSCILLSHSLCRLRRATQPLYSTYGHRSTPLLLAFAQQPLI